ncbi:MAG: ABC transporter ATP-binding protein [Sphaerochaeta sp.]|jgi:iron complex transport system ATP-binding protein|nr:ABC transporter ATP-binding protein [Sphaerochaeta sp.]MCH3920083.1 ABC transporter ATP-binding protein [Sphaerochaeta sp.]MCI2076937.1 ABC transporter ATP-binding protein [Sphaerochaeta sp.]MCI2096273.1 ABC transporter ATP-binding protein [Sphaerochaeta sp.]MCI2104190.1 ABC transporter ATP-binding protein [Sphaerochaeta sp.]
MSIVVSGLTYGYGEGKLALDHVDFSARDGQVTSVIGSNGAGKTTLLKCVLGIRSGWTGRIMVDGTDVRTLSRKALSRQLAYVPQISYPTFNYPCVEMVLMGANNRVGALGSPGAREREEALATMDGLGIASLADRLFLEVSGGERQLVLVARSLMQKAKNLLLDEPVANLDLGNQIKVLEEVSHLAEQGYAVVMTTHNPEQAYQYSSSIAVFKDGRLFSQGTPQEVMTEGMIKSVYGVDVRMESLYDDAIRVCVHRKQGEEK